MNPPIGREMGTEREKERVCPLYAAASEKFLIHEMEMRSRNICGRTDCPRHETNEANVLATVPVPANSVQAPTVASLPPS